ncbi:translation initiation factor eIF4A [Mortierella claussenii]|nr:translation initiation factor eIF4A [Mortierella claussenii]
MSEPTSEPMSHQAHGHGGDGSGSNSNSSHTPMATISQGPSVSQPPAGQQQQDNNNNSKDIREKKSQFDTKQPVNASSPLGSSSSSSTNTNTNTNISTSNNTMVDNVNSGHTPSTSVSTSARSGSTPNANAPSHSNASSPRASRGKRNNNASTRGGGGSGSFNGHAPKSPSLGGMTENVEGGLKSLGDGPSNAKMGGSSGSEATVEVGVISGGENRNKNQTGGTGGSFSNRRGGGGGGSGKFNGDRPGHHSSFSSSTRGGFSGRGRGAEGDEGSARGRKSDRKGWNRSETGESGKAASTPAAAATVVASESGSQGTDPSGSQDGTTSTSANRRSQNLESLGVSETKKWQSATRSPRSPRSPRRGFGERGMESKKDAVSATPDATVAGGSGNGSPVMSSDPAGPVKKRKPVKKNNIKEKEENEQETPAVSMDSAKEDNATLKEGKNITISNSKKDWKKSETGIDVTSKQENNNSSTWTPKSKVNRSTLGPQRSDSKESSWSGSHINNGSRPPFKSANSRGRKDDAATVQQVSTTGIAEEKIEGWAVAPVADLLTEGGWGAPPPAPSSTDGWGAPPPDSGSTDGWGAPPAETNNTNRWSEQPAASGRREGWSDSPSTKPHNPRSEGRNSTFSKSRNEGWNDSAAHSKGDKKREPRETRPFSRKESWNKPSSAPVKDDGGGSPASPASEQTSNHTEGWGEPPESASALAASKKVARDHSSASSQNKGWGDSPKTPISTEKKDDAATASAPKSDGWGDAPASTTESGWGNTPASTTENGWGDTPELTTGGGWGESSRANAKWGEELPWETQNTPQSSSNTSWNKGFDDSHSNNNNHRNSDHQATRGGRGGRGGKAVFGGSSDARFASSHQQQYYQRDHGSRRLHDSESDPPKDVRSSLDARNARLGIQRGPRFDYPRNLSDDGRSSDTGLASATSSAPSENKGAVRSDAASSENERLNTRSPAGSSMDIRLDPKYYARQNALARSNNSINNSHQRGGPFSNQFKQSNQSSSSVASSADTQSQKQHGSPALATKENKPGLAAQAPKAPKARDSKGFATMFSDSLECQVTWKEMNLRPNVIASIAKAGLKKPSNIQKLVMAPFKQGRDVIAQSQSQNDRTNTLAIALLQKLSTTAATQKHCQALVICSEGINPQKVHEDFQTWFESAPGLQSVLLSSDMTAERAILADPEQAKQVVVTTLGPLMEVLRNSLMDMKAVGTVVISMRSVELVNFDAFKQFWVTLSRDAQVILMTGRIQSQIQLIKTHHFRADTAVRRADELTMQWSEHYYVNIPTLASSPSSPSTLTFDDKQDEEGQTTTKDPKWDVLMEILTKNPSISHTVILTQSQSVTQALTTKLKAQKLPVLSVWSMADKTDVARQFNGPDPCILVSESILMDNLDLDYSSLMINYEMPKRAAHYISSFGPFGRSGLRTLVINFCVTENPLQRQMLQDMEALYDIKIQEMQLD